MIEQTGKRRMAAVLAADVAGYSRLMGEDEEATIAALGRARAVFREHVGVHDGRVVDTAGDSVLSVFESVIEAVRAALAVQETLTARNEDVPEDRRMQFRIGVHFGDIVEQDDGTIYGDGVNIAARLEGLAEPGGLTVSGTVHEHIEGKLGVGLADLGEQEVKNIARPVRAWRVAAGGDAAPSPTKRPVRFALVAAAAVLVVVVASAWWLSRDDTPAPMLTAGGTPTDDPVLAVPMGPAIAVLPLTNQSGDPAHDYFSAGLTEDLINRLSRFQQFRVIARNSTAQYKGETVDLKAIHRDLGARYVVDGGVHRLGDRLRVAIYLADASNGTHLWSETYDRDLLAADLFDIQDDIARRVVAVIADFQGIVLRAGIKAAAGKPPADLNAYDCELRLVAYYDGATPEEHAIIRDCAERAVERDPTAAGAWRTLAWLYSDEHRFNFNPRPDSFDRSLDAARRAVKLNANDAGAHMVLASAYADRNEIDSFLAEAERALALNPNNAFHLAYSGLKMIEAGILDRGIDLLNKGIDLNPNHPTWYHWGTYHYHFRRGEYEAALSAIQKLGWPDYFWTHAQTAAVLGQLGRLEEARASVDRLLELYPDFADHYWEEIAKHNFPDEASMLYVEGYRKAGLDVPDKSALTQ
jgi:adenylate cyclase